MASQLSRQSIVAGLLGSGLMVGGCGLPSPFSAASRPRVRRVGFVSGASVAAEDQALVEGLAAFGWLEGKNLVIERRFYGEYALSANALMVELANHDDRDWRGRPRGG